MHSHTTRRLYDTGRSATSLPKRRLVKFRRFEQPQDLEAPLRKLSPRTLHVLPQSQVQTYSDLPLCVPSFITVSLPNRWPRMSLTPILQF